ncbi:MAG: ATP-dependent Clp protease ATP-binding subunit [Flavobacteriaceae bacterium]|nr:ATP-dependent Clp protease ATP-binding subunit [Flavobacteriaceae bacterium]
MIENNFSPSLVAAVRLAKSLAMKESFSTYGVAHLAIALLLEPTGLTEILTSTGKDLAYIQDWFEMRQERYVSEEKTTEEGILPDSEVTRVFEESERSKIKLGTDYIDAVCVFTAILRQGVVYDNKQLETLTIREEDILSLYDSPIYSSKSLTESETSEFIETIPYCTSLITQKNLDQGSLIIGRDKEIRRILESLERQENRGVLVVGDSGVGKTGIIKALVNYLSESENPLLIEKMILGLNASKLLANSANSNEVAKKLSDIFDKIGKLEDCLLVIDDIHVLTENAGSSGSITNLIASQLADGNINLIATITTDAYRKTIEKHGINRKLEVIKLEELEEILLLKCLDNHRYNLTAHYQLKIDKEAISEAIQYSRRYFKENKLPYGAIDILDRTLAAVFMSNNNSLKEIEIIEKQLKNVALKEEDAVSKMRLIYRLAMDRISPVILNKIATTYDIMAIEEVKELRNTLKKYLKEAGTIAKKPIKEITETEISALVASITGIPIGKIQAEEKDRLLNIEKKLNERVKGQDHAITTLSDAIIESRSGLSNPNQPIGSFFFLGPTGTGKTELTKSLASLLFDDENAMIRFDMSEFKEEHSAALLYGAPPGYVGYEEGGMLVNKIREKPYSVVLFDEIEKAHSSVYDVFLQIMDEGKIHDKLGREGDFSNSIIIFTSNIGSQWISEQIDAGKIPSSNQLIEVMTQHFRPEFLGRLTEVVPFSPINEGVAQLIFKLQFNSLQQQLLEQKNIILKLSEQALVFLSDKGYSKKYGARPIAGVIRTYIKKVISRMIVSESIVSGDVVLVNYKEGNLIWEKQ